MPPVEEVTVEGYDLQFGTNCLGHWYLTQLLMPTVLEAARNSPRGSVRVITTSSLAHVFHPGPGFDWETLQRGDVAMPSRKKLGAYGLYAQSKFVRFSSYLMIYFSDDMFFREMLSLHLNWRNVFVMMASFRFLVIPEISTPSFSGT